MTLLKNSQKAVIIDEPVEPMAAACQVTLPAQIEDEKEPTDTFVTKIDSNLKSGGSKTSSDMLE